MNVRLVERVEMDKLKFWEWGMAVETQGGE